MVTIGRSPVSSRLTVVVVVAVVAVVGSDGGGDAVAAKT